MNNRILLIFLTLLLLSSCKKDIISFNFTEKKRLNVSDLDFEYFQAKSKIKFDDGVQDFNANAHVRIKKDSVIWISVTPAIGIEVFRAVLTQDSAFLINRIKKEYNAYSMDSIRTRYNFPLDFNMLQSAILGNLIHKREKVDKVTKREGFFILHQKTGDLVINNRVNSKTMKVESVSVIDEPNLNSLEINYKDFQFVNKHLIPHDNVFLVKYKSEKSDAGTEMNIAFNRVTVDDKKIKFPFNIPNKYVSSE